MYLEAKNIYIYNFLTHTYIICLYPKEASVKLQHLVFLGANQDHDENSLAIILENLKQIKSLKKIKGLSYIHLSHKNKTR